MGKKSAGDRSSWPMSPLRAPHVGGTRIFLDHVKRSHSHPFAQAEELTETEILRVCKRGFRTCFSDQHLLQVSETPGRAGFGWEIWGGTSCWGARCSRGQVVVFFLPPKAESFGVSAQIGSGVVRGGPEVRFHQGSTRVPRGSARAAGWCEHKKEHRMLSPELILFLSGDLC